MAEEQKNSPGLPVPQQEHVGDGEGHADTDDSAYSGADYEEHSEEEASDEGNPASGGKASPRWMPPASDRSESESFVRFGNAFSSHFYVPKRIVDKSLELIETANDFHYAMINDLPRNQFYHDALSAVVTPDSIVVEIGTGSGLLAMIACKAGAKHVTAIEANRHLADIARMNISKNGMQDRITVINALSTDVKASDLPHGKADVLVRVHCSGCGRI